MISEDEVYIPKGKEFRDFGIFIYVEIVSDWIRAGIHSPVKCVPMSYVRSDINRGFDKIEKVPGNCKCGGQLFWE